MQKISKIIPVKFEESSIKHYELKYLFKTYIQRYCLGLFDPKSSGSTDQFSKKQLTTEMTLIKTNLKKLAKNAPDFDTPLTSPFPIVSI